MNGAVAARVPPAGHDSEEERTGGHSRCVHNKEELFPLADTNYAGGGTYCSVIAMCLLAPPFRVAPMAHVGLYLVLNC